ncbi:hypothetical protein OJF2_68770 [Aquisphaera giovannonii]|uniref:Glycoside hydrolase family 42 N-terminal domain-containing protein n=1 Tax=Aquisphaera giovannonii TaxID=406548 RepID=A0A5B9WDG5_9BACT|nr:hypothetical protein [Aquisphaera giovannonii]QEH38279.1 hypothetical protein OJF2_68770 [Aquisphaera giovannonii]
MVRQQRLASFVGIFILAIPPATAGAAEPWKVGEPIVAYWAGPGFPGGGPLDDAAADQLAAGGWNLAWCTRPEELDVARRHRLRGLFSSTVLSPDSLADPTRREALVALVDRVRSHPAMYAYHITDEPGASAFPALGRLVAFLRERDPAHLAYINLLPTYANNQQLGVDGPILAAYEEHLRRFVEEVRPGLLSYDHYQFRRGDDAPDYFLNLALVRKRALDAGIPFLNIVQASSWVPGAAASPSSPRVPGPDELRFLVYTTLAYGAQGISYYVYHYPAHEGGMIDPDGKPSARYRALRALNPEFVAIARELQPLRSLAVHHAGPRPPGAVPLPEDGPFRLAPPIPPEPFKAGDRARGILLGSFGPAGAKDDSYRDATHVVVVNLDYRDERTTALAGPSPLEVFDAATGRWAPANGPRVELRLAGGAGKLVRVAAAPRAER